MGCDIMINHSNPYANFHCTINHTCPYCGGHNYTNTGLCTINGIEFACNNCGQTFYIPMDYMPDFISSSRYYYGE